MDIAVKEVLLMAREGESFDQWVDEARIPRRLRSLEHLAVLRAVFVFLRQAGNDYASQRIAAHFLLNCQLGWKLAQVARLVGIARPTASRQNKLSSRQVVREIQHRFAGRPYGKLLPRYTGPIAQFLLTHPQASRDDLLDFIESTWNVRISLTALHTFLKQYGLDRASLDQAASGKTPHLAGDERALIEALQQPSAPGLPVPRPPEDFFLDTPNTRAPSS
jgi:hypothetical protein